MMKKVKLTNGTELEFEEQSPRFLFEIIISEILIPKYKETDDWNFAINVIIEEMTELIKQYDLNPKLKLDLLSEVEAHLNKDIEELTGVAKIEILFINMEDYLMDIEKLITSGLDKQELRHQMARVIKPLTLFELGELFILIGKKAFLK
jgi:hypothetical protein